MSGKKSCVGIRKNIKKKKKKKNQPNLKYLNYYYYMIADISCSLRPMNEEQNLDG